MIIQFIILLVSFYILVKSSDYFVKSSSSIAKTFGISEFVIGLTLVAIGTSIPELASSIAATFNGSGSMVIGNVVGSNIANIALILGLTALFYPIPKNKEQVSTDGYILLFITVLLALVLFDLKLEFVEGLVLAILYVIYLMFLFETQSKQNEVKRDFKEFINYVAFFKYYKKFKFIFAKKNKEVKVEDSSFKKDIVLKNSFVLLLSVIGIIIGAKFLILEATFFAKLFGLSEIFIGLTILAIGTSLPELSVTLSAIKNGFSDIAIGNIIGSNIANILMVAGVSSLFSNLGITQSSLYILMPFLLLITTMFLVFLRFKGINRINGALFLLVYVLFILESMFI